MNEIAAARRRGRRGRRRQPGVALGVDEDAVAAHQGLADAAAEALGGAAEGSQIAARVLGCGRKGQGDGRHGQNCGCNPSHDIPLVKLHSYRRGGGD